MCDFGPINSMGPKKPPCNENFLHSLNVRMVSNEFLSYLLQYDFISPKSKNVSFFLTKYLFFTS